LKITETRGEKEGSIILRHIATRDLRGVKKRTVIPVKRRPKRGSSHHPSL